MKLSFLLIAFVFLSSQFSYAENESVSIACDRVHIEDEGPIVLNFAGGPESKLKNLEEGCGSEGLCKEPQFFELTSSKSLGTWPLGIYAGHNKKRGSYIVNLSERIFTQNPYTQLKGHVVQISTRVGQEPQVSIDAIECYAYMKD